MKLSTKISLLFGLVSFSTIMLLTVLMHLRYHMTRQNLINDRINVTMNNIANSMESNIKSGVDIQSLGNINNLIKYSKGSDPIIDDIYVFAVTGDLLKPTFSTSKTEVAKKTLVDFFRKIKGSKTVNWSMDIDSKQTAVGLSVRDNAGLDRALITVSYSKEFIRKKEAAEVNALYLRMLVAGFFAGMAGFIIGFLTTRELSSNLECINNQLTKIESGKLDSIDLSEITDPVLKSHLRSMINKVSGALKKIYKVKAIVASIKKDSTKEGKI